MAKNEFKPFATGSGANVTTQTDWESLPVLSAGFTSGKASSAQVNKGLRQGTAMAAAVGQFIADNTNEDVKDNGDIAGLSAQLASAVEQAATGRLIGVRTITTSGTYTPTPGTKSIIVEVQGAGGGGAGAGTTSSSAIAIGSGGSAGAYAKSLITNLAASYAVVVGLGGSGGNGSANGLNGGASSFGSLITANGGFGGGFSNGAPPALNNATGAATASGGNLINITGAPPMIAMALSFGVCIAGGGGNSMLGNGGGAHGTAGGGSPASGYGAGGGGANAYQSNSIIYRGADGGNGVIFVWEFS